MNKYFFQNIHVISPLENIDITCNLFIDETGHISYPDETFKPSNDCIVIDAKDLIAAPGFVDMHVHLREPGQEYKETIATGTAAAANGGFTDIVCMPNTQPAIDSKITLEYIKHKAHGNIVDVHICAATTIGRNGEQLTPMIELLESGAVMFSDDGSCVESPEMMRRAFEYLAPFDGLLTQHCEEHSMTKDFVMHEGSISAELGVKGYPSIAEELIVNRDIQLALYCGNRRYHVSHMSTKGSVQLVREAKARGQRVTCEVTPHHFMFTHEAIKVHGTHAKMNPPLREQIDVDAILLGLADGTIDAIATDHAPHAEHEKHCELALAANGIIGLETCIGLTITHLVKTGIIDFSRMIDILSIGPRNILRMDQPSLLEGSKACLTIFNPEEKWIPIPDKSHSKSQNSPFFGIELTGKPRYTVNNGQVFESIL
jgi:dihydroorotase